MYAHLVGSHGDISIICIIIGFHLAHHSKAPLSIFDIVSSSKFFHSSIECFLHPICRTLVVYVTRYLSVCTVFICFILPNKFARFASARSTPVRSAPDRVAPVRFAPDRFARARSTPARFASVRFASVRFAPVRFARVPPTSLFSHC